MPVDCRKCIHFKITWENNRPYACKAFGFKTKNIPSRDVFLSSGTECLKFTPKQTNKDDSLYNRRK